MMINYPLHVQERFARLLEQRAIQAKKSKASMFVELVGLECVRSARLSAGENDVEIHNNRCNVPQEQTGLTVD